VTATAAELRVLADRLLEIAKAQLAHPAPLREAEVQALNNAVRALLREARYAAERP
jgi:hypothetical protein